MGMGNPTDGREALVARVKNILVTPDKEWTVIDAEPATVGSIYMTYVVPLAAIPALAGLIGRLVFGFHFLGITYRPPVMTAVGTAIAQFVMALIGTFVLALIIDALAPSFGGTKNRVQALKVAAYASTAGWVAGIFQLIPMLGWLGILGLYSLYLLYLGLPKLMRSPPEKSVGYIAAVIVAGIVIFFVIGALSATVGRAFYSPSVLAAGDTSAAGTLSVPGVGSVDLSKLEQASKQAQAATNGQTPPVQPAALQALLPDSLGSFHRTEISSSGANAGGLGGAEADARYEDGDKSIHLTVTDMAAAGALAGLGSALNIQSSRQTATGYEKTGMVDGRMTSEKWDSSDKNGSFSVMVGNRFSVQAEGTVDGIDQLKQAVAAIPLDKMDQLAGK